MDLESSWNLYLATRLHYLYGYDAIKYRGKYQSAKKMQERPDKILARASLTNLESKRQVVEYCIANFLYENDDFLYASSDDADRYYKDWCCYWKNAKRNIQNDLSLLELRLSQTGLTLDQYFLEKFYQDLLLNKFSREFSCILAKKHPDSFSQIGGFGSERFKDRVMKTIPFIEKRLTELEIDLESIS